MSAPFAKVNETSDGGREVWGFATLEVVDKAGEVADFDGTVKAFETWSNEVSKRTGGKSLGNVRVMHEKIPAGKTIHWEPTEKTVTKDDGTDEVIKGIYVGAYIPPTKPEIIKDVDEGILSAFSIGGGYEKRWYDTNTKAFRYIPVISEYSLVDNPCVPGADIVNVIAKADGPWDKNYSNYEKGENILENENQELNKRAKLAGSYEELQRNIEAAVANKLKGYSNYWDGYVIATMPDKVVVYDYNTRKYLEIPYTNTDGTITVGDTVTEVKEVTTYIPVEVQKAVEAELKKRSSVISNEGGENKTETSSNKEEDNLNKGNVISNEALSKACEAVGITTDQFSQLLKAVIPQDDDNAIKTNVTEVDGDFDHDKNGEFPAPGEPTIPIEGAKAVVDNAEAATYKAFLDEMKKSFDGLIEDSNKLEKANVAISKDRMNHLKHAKAHIDAAVNGTLYGPDEHLVIEGKAGQGNTGEEPAAATEKVILGSLQKGIDGVNESLNKAFNESLEKSVSKLEALFKGVATAETLSKAIETLSKTATELDEVKKLVKEIYETPQPNNLVFNGGSPDMMKMLGQGGHFNMQSTEDDILKKFVAEIQDPLVKDKASQELALRQYKNSLNQGGK